ncbi:NAD(P)/FAD-dependent oxidoreductase [Sulfitobacter aestuarii]|uniref:NAD(P)/FAD-dependent oxidoreductase n=1 Tax=Sulfitobacter aestuarii TaxID=2161676 RepID=A0ABW5TXA8_9RHOB
MVDITIRGAGIFGLSIAWSCAQRGASVRIVDPNGAASGSSGGIVGALAPHVPENWNAKKAFQLESLLMAQRFWTEVEAVGGLDAGYVRAGRLQPIADEAALVLARQRAESAAQLWYDQASWQVRRASGAEWEPLSPSGWLIEDDLSAHIHPRLACAALVAALRCSGVEVEAEAPDRGRVVWATGTAGLEALNAGHSRQVGIGIKGQAALLAHDAGKVPQLFAGGVHVIPHGDGTVAVGSTTEREFTSAATTDRQIDAVIEAARKAVPVLRRAEVIETWAGLRPRARSRAPMLGPWPGHEGHYIANGGFKIGFGMAPKVAQVMADLLLEDRDNIPEGFRVEDSL